LSQSRNFPVRTQIAFYENLTIIPVQQVHFLHLHIRFNNF